MPAQRNKAREHALTVLRRVEDGLFADVLLDRSRQDLDGRDNAFVTELVYGVLRNRSRLDWILNIVSAQPVSKTDAWTRNILRLAAYQMLFLDKIPVSAAVNTAVDLAKQHGKKNGYVNGMLRNLDRRRDSLPDTLPEDSVRKLAILYSHPEWLVRRWVVRLGREKAETALSRNNQPAPLTVRINSLKTSREALLDSLKAGGSEAAETDFSPSGIRILSSPGIRSLASYREGLFIVQDEAAQLISMMLNPRPGETVLDACAAPGGKTTHLAQLMENRGRIVAIDIDPARIAKIRDNGSRLGMTIIETVKADAAHYNTEARFDRILVDAPCSALGLLRRHPDGRWNKSEEVIRERASLQRSILVNCASLLKPDGVLVYATCTTEPEENENVIMDFMARTPGFRIDDPRPDLFPTAASLVDDSGFFRTFPDRREMDGFFGVRLCRDK